LMKSHLHHFLHKQDRVQLENNFNIKSNFQNLPNLPPPDIYFIYISINITSIESERKEQNNHIDFLFLIASTLNNITHLYI
jgi:hypothetical protein